MGGVRFRRRRQIRRLPRQLGALIWTCGIWKSAQDRLDVLNVWI